MQALNLRQPIDRPCGGGASGAWIRERVDIPMAMVEVRGLDLLQALRQAKLQTTKEAPRGVWSTSRCARLPVVAQFDSLFGLVWSRSPIKGPHDDAPACVQKLRASGRWRAVVAPGLRPILAEQAGVASVLLYSDISVRQALSDATLLARHRRAERDRHQRLKPCCINCRMVVADGRAWPYLRAEPRMAACFGAPVDACTAACWKRWPGPGHGSRARWRGAAERWLQLALQYPGVVRRAPVVGERAGDRRFAGLPRSSRHSAGRSQPAAPVSGKEPPVYAGALRTIWAAAALPRVRLLARQQYANSDATVLILGESGTGGELVAQGIPQRGAAACGAAISWRSTARGAQRKPAGERGFGYEEGALPGPGAAADRANRSAAHTGTLFLR